MRDFVTLQLNGETRNIRGVSPTRTLLEYLRETERLKGTKEGCAEGDCGSCTVVVGEAVNGDVRYRAVNSCIQFFGMLEGKAVLTVEHLKAPDGRLHPIQQAMVDEHGSQCGFCTPGFITAMYAAYLSGDVMDTNSAADLLAGNLCRCASYGPIAYSPDTGLLYVNAIDRPFNAGRGPKGYFSAYDPTTGELVWRQIFEGYGQGGAVVTKGGVVFVGTGSNIAGYFFAYNARTGEELWRYNTGSGIYASPAVYMVDGEEFVTVASGGGSRGRRGGDLILSFALPKQ